MQGHRGHMEDRIITKSYFNNVYSIYIVFDGHGGDTVVKYAEKEFVKFILDEGEKLFKSFEENPEKYCPNKIKGCKLSKLSICYVIQLKYVIIIQCLKEHSRHMIEHLCTKNLFTWLCWIQK